MTGHWISIDRTEKPSLSVPLRTDGHWAVDGLVGCWDFTEGAGRTHFDRSGNGNDGTQQNTSWSSFWTAGEYGGAGDFDGSNDYVEASPPGITDYPVTMAIRCRPDTVATAFPLVFSDEATNTNYAAIVTLNTGAVRAQIASTATAAVAEGGSYSAGEDITIVARFTSSTSRDVWLNGELVDTDTASEGFPSGIDNSTIGALQRTTVTNHFNGKIYWAKLWDRALTDDQIVSLHANPNQIYEPHRMFLPGAAGVGGGTIPIFYHHYAMLRAY